MESKNNISDYLKSQTDYRVFDVNQEWDDFLQKAEADQSVQEENGIVVPLSTKEKKSNKRFIFSIAASFLILIVAYFVLSYEAPLYKSISTLANSEMITLDEGSSIELFAYSDLKYPRSTKKLDERRMFLTGKATFKVSESEKPFIVELNETAVKVLGTKFVVLAKASTAEVENLEGQIKFYAVDDEENGVVLNPGDKFRFEGGAFTPVIEEVLAPVYTIEEIADYLFNTYEDQVSPTAGLLQDAYYSPQGRIAIDLTQDLPSIIAQLESLADFKYVKENCENCYRIQVFKSKE